MKKNRRPYQLFDKASAVFMILTLLWLTLSTPFVYASQQQLSQKERSGHCPSPLAGSEEEASAPLGNTTEEKNPNSSSSLSEEYLHDHHTEDHFFSISSQYHKCENADDYIAYHGELHVPPPDVA